jgi:hypothetical protein
MLFVGSAAAPRPLFLFVFLCFSGGARFFVLSRFLQPACLFYIALEASTSTTRGTTSQLAALHYRYKLHIVHCAFRVQVQGAFDCRLCHCCLLIVACGTPRDMKL